MINPLFIFLFPTFTGQLKIWEDFNLRCSCKPLNIIGVTAHYSCLMQIIYGPLVILILIEPGTMILLCSSYFLWLNIIPFLVNVNDKLDIFPVKNIIIVNSEKQFCSKMVFVVIGTTCFTMTWSYNFACVSWFICLLVQSFS